MGRLSEAIEREFGFPVQVEFSPKAVSVTTTQQEVLKGNPDRLSFVMFNLGAQIAYVHFNQYVGPGLGFYLDKNGGFIALNYKEDGELVGLPWHVVGAGSTTIYVAAIEGA